jgi:nucleotide-binding universal stress UspA family protein
MKILLATDGSEYAEHAARFLSRIDWSADDAITVFHAIFALPFPEDETFHHDTLKAIKKELAPRIIDSAMAVLKPVRAALSVEIEESPPVKCTPENCIIETAEASASDLIVMGTRGKKGLAPVFLGSVTRSVSMKSRLPVLVVKPKALPRPGAMKILLAVDGSEQSRAAGAFLSTIPFPRAAEVTLLNVLSSTFVDIPERFILEVDERIKEYAAARRAAEYADSGKIVEETEKTLSAGFGNIRVLSKTGDPAEEILKTAEELDADLIVIGGGGKGTKGVLGRVSRNVLNHSKSPVLLVKERRP